MRFKEYLLENNLLSDLSFLITEEKTPEHILKQGREIAKRLNVKFNGWWDELNKFCFTDDKKTKTTFVGKDFQEAQQKLIDKRKQFAMA